MKKMVSGMFLAILVMGMLILAFNIQPVKALGTVYIRGDGSVDPSTAPIQRDRNNYTFTGNINDSIVIERDIIVVDGAGYTLKGTEDGNGIDLNGRSNVTIKNTTIKAFKYGIYLLNSSYNSIVGNNITNNNADGVYLYNSSSNSIVGNKITNNTKGDGIFLLSSSNHNSIVGNNITNNNIGILPCNSFSNSIVGNNITANKESGIGLSESSSNNVIYHNNFVHNFQQQVHYAAETVGCANCWDDGYPSGGNYWSDYNGQDRNGDGIGDTPYVFDANYTNNRDNYPLMNPWSPVVQTYTPPLFWIIIAVAITIIVLAAIVVVRKRRKKPFRPAVNRVTLRTLEEQ